MATQHNLTQPQAGAQHGRLVRACKAGDLEIAMTGEKMIPTKHVAFCKAVAKLAAMCGLTSLGMTFKPGYGDGWNDPIQMAWESGRHGEDGKRAVITSTLMVRIES